jgi:multiple sugar transport system permease protein
MRKSRSTATVIALFAGPAVLLGVVTLILPLLAVIALSFTSYRLGAHSLAFVGWQNFTSIASDPVVRHSLQNTIVYSALVVPASMITGLAVALLINARTSLSAVYRTIHFLPVMAATIAIAVVWEFMLQPNFGLVNLLLAEIGIRGPHWLDSPETSLLSLAIIGIWQMSGFNMVLFLTGMTSIAPQFYEAAEMDGAATGWDRFWLVTWPLLKPITGFVFVISIIRSFQLFETVYVITSGGPQKSTEVLLFTMFSEAFTFFRTGRAAAIAVVFLVLVGSLTLLKHYFSAQRSSR